MSTNLLVNRLGSDPANTRLTNETLVALQNIKKQYKGAKCDSEGFYQHFSECWNDAIQMIFLFTDGLKEIVQKKLAMNVVDESFIPYPDLPLKRAKSLFSVNISKEFLLKDAILYFKSLQDRFVRHYTLETESRECPLVNPINTMHHRLHVNGATAIRGATFGRPNTKFTHVSEYNEDSKGGSNEEIKYLLYLYIDTFFSENGIPSISYKTLPYTSQNKEDAYESFTGSKILAILINNGFHELCFYTCGTQDFFYEDNNGPLLFPWRKYLKEIKEVYLFKYYKYEDPHRDYYPVLKLYNGKCLTIFNNKEYFLDSTIEYNIETGKFADEYKIVINKKDDEYIGTGMNDFNMILEYTYILGNNTNVTPVENINYKFDPTRRHYNRYTNNTRIPSFKTKPYSEWTAENFKEAWPEEQEKWREYYKSHTKFLFRPRHGGRRLTHKKRNIQSLVNKHKRSRRHHPSKTSRKLLEIHDKQGR